MTLFFIEIQPRIQAAHVSIYGSSKTVSYTCNSISHAGALSGDEKATQCVVCSWKSPNLLFAPSPTVKLLPNEGLYMRFKTSRDLEAEKILSRAFPATEDKCPSSVVFRCGFCNQAITKMNNVFKRVLPLPSESWSEFSGNAFCHGDNHTPSQLTPREGDLLVGGSIFMLDGKSLDPDHLSVQDVDQIVCRRCRSVCGSVLESIATKTASNSDVHSLSISDVSVEIQRSNISSRSISAPWTMKDRSNYFAQKLYLFTKAKMAFQFTVRDQTEKIYCSVWMMNAITRVIHNHENFRDIDVLEKILGYCSQKSSDLPADYYALRVMYKSHLNEPKSSTVAVDSEVMEMDTRECLELLLLLSFSNRVLPPSKRTVSGYKIGLLQIRHAKGC